jgi:hypothetical protein
MVLLEELSRPLRPHNISLSIMIEGVSKIMVMRLSRVSIIIGGRLWM